ncbi:hypothetical protein DFJ74DRAFT_53291 [Hyaloraphidium curvatum]|nr:hypothetical protein DFJ74DRAFT_53291 [Hyaloraphidium curvatum]
MALPSVGPHSDHFERQVPRSKGKAKAPPGGADGDGLEPPPSKVGKVCGRCGGADHERASNRLCPYHKPTIKATAKKDVEQVTGKTVPSTIKLPIKGLCTSSPASFASVHDTLALAYTPVAIAAALLLNEVVAAWVTDNRVLPQLNQSLLRRVFSLCASGELRIQASDSLQGQEEFLRSLERIWLGDGTTPGLRASYPARFAAFRAPGAQRIASPDRMIDQYFSSEFDNIYNATFKDYQVNIEVHLESAANRNFIKVAELRFDKLPWWNAVVDGDPEKELPAERKSAIFSSLLSASKSRRRPLRIFSRTAAAGDHYLTEQDVEQAVAAGQSLTYGWKTPSMQHHRSAVLGPHFLEALLRDVRAGRDLHVSMRGEFASWFEEEFETIMETVVLNKVARAQLAKDLVARITSTGAHKFSARHIALGEGPAAIPWDTLQAAANTGNDLLLHRRSGKAVVQNTLQHGTIVLLVTFLQEAWARQNDIERNGMQGGVKDWNTRLRFLHRSNCLIGALYDITVPAGPFDPQWQPPLPPTSALLPYFNYQTKHVKVATFDALLEVVKRHKRMFPVEHAAVMDDHFPFGEEFDETNEYHRRRLWAAVYDTDSLLQREVRGGFRDNYVGDKTRAFAFAVSSNGVEASVLFNKAVPNDDFEPEGEAREAGGADDEARIVREAAAAAFHAGLRRGMERAVQFEDQARRGEIKLHVQGLDPGPGGFTLARRTEDGEARSKVLFYSFKQYHYESGVRKRKRQQEALTKTMHVTTAAGPVSIQNIINAIPASTITAVDDIHRRNMYILTHLDTLVRFYSEFRDERFQNYRGKQIALERMAQELLAMEHESKTGSPKTVETKAARRNRKGWRRWFRSKRRKRAGGNRLPERYVIVWGNAKVGSMSWIKKQMRGPFKKLIALLEARSDVVVVMEDEYGTSKCCHSCDQWSLDTRRCRQMPKELEPTYRPPVVAEGEQAEERKWHVPMVIPTKKPWYVRW